MIQLLFYFPLSRALHDARKQAGARQTDIAEQAGLSVPTVRLLEHGKGTIESLDAVLECLNLEIYGDRLPRSGNRGERIAGLRKARGISQRDLAKEIGVSPTPIITIENHWRGRVETLDTILSALDAGAFLAGPDFDAEAAVRNTHQFRSVSSVMDPLQEIVGTFDLSPCPNVISGRELPIKARKEYAAADDGLRLPWTGTVILNPPYNDDLPAWVRKAHDEYERGTASLVVAMLPAWTDRAWWHLYVADVAAVIFLRGTVAFSGEAHPMPSALAIWGATETLLSKVQDAYPESWVIGPRK